MIDRVIGNLDDGGALGVTMTTSGGQRRTADGGPVTETSGELSGVVARAIDGDAGAWRDLIRMYGRRVYGFAVSRCGDSEVAEEITQSVFATLAEKLRPQTGVAERGKYHEAGRFEAWLFRIAANRVRDEIRRRRRAARLTEALRLEGASGTGGPNGTGQNGLADRSDRSGRAGIDRAGGEGAGLDGAGIDSAGIDGAGIGGAGLDGLGASRLREAMESLSDADREVIALRHHGQMSFKQMAELLDEPVGTLLARHHRALRKLRGLLEASGEPRGRAKEGVQSDDIKEGGVQKRPGRAGRLGG